MSDKPGTILLAEDNDAHADLVEVCLSNHRVVNTIYRVADGQELLDYLFRQNNFFDPKDSPRPDLILLDLRMPKVDGMEVLKKLKSTEELRRIPILILTTSSAKSDLETAYDLHANSYLVKPTEFKELSDMLSDLSYYWLNWNQSPNETTENNISTDESADNA